MNILQKQFSKNHNTAFFYHGVIAESNGFKLETFQTGEIMFMGNQHNDVEIIELGKKELINDFDIENEGTIDILVDKFIAISKDGVFIEEGELIFNEYDEALEGFENFLSKLNQT